MTDGEALALAAEVSVDSDADVLALDSVSALGSGKNCSLFCNGKRVTPDEDAMRLGGNKTHVCPRNFWPTDMNLKQKRGPSAWRM